jgi:serine/threonine protein kinase
VFEFYDFREQIGKGAFSRVVKAQHKASKRWVAIKIIDKCTLTPLNYVYNKSI